MRLLATFSTTEEREFLMEMVEPALVEGKTTLLSHEAEALEDVDDIEAMVNNVARQQRRMKFLLELYTILKGCV